MVARAVVEHVAFCDSSNNRKLVTEAMRDPIGKLGSMNAIAAPYQISEKNGRGSLVRIDQFSGRPITSPAQDVTRLALEVLEAVDADPLYGPRYDKERNIVGLEHEILLEQALISMSKLYFTISSHRYFLIEQLTIIEFVIFCCNYG